MSDRTRWIVGGNTATGFIAIGNVVTGFIAIGNVARGFIAIGNVAVGVRIGGANGPAEVKKMRILQVRLGQLT